MVDWAFGATAMASIFAIVDPLGVVPFFSVLTDDLDAFQKQQIVSKACLTATVTLGVFAVFGQGSSPDSASRSRPSKSPAASSYSASRSRCSMGSGPVRG